MNGSTVTSPGVIDSYVALHQKRQLVRTQLRDIDNELKLLSAAILAGHRESCETVFRPTDQRLIVRVRTRTGYTGFTQKTLGRLCNQFYTSLYPEASASDVSGVSDRLCRWLWANRPPFSIPFVSVDASCTPYNTRRKRYRPLRDSGREDQGTS